MADPKPLSREQLAKFLPDQEAVRRFERLFQVAGDLTPAQIGVILRLIQEVTIDAGTAGARATSAIAMVEALEKALEASATRPGFSLPRRIPLDYLEFAESPAYPGDVRQVAWNAAEDTLDIRHSRGVTQQVGQELYGFFVNDIGSAITNGEVIGFDTTAGAFTKFIADGSFPIEAVIGVATSDIPSGEAGRATVWGRVRDIDTTGTPFGETWAAGDILYVSTTVAGGLTNAKPTAPNLSIPIALVRVVSGTIGEIAVRPVIEQQLYYGSFVKTTDQIPSAVNTAQAITWSSELIANGVSIDGGTPSRIVVANSGLYKFSTSYQLTSSSASTKNVWLWFRKNGVDVADSAMITSLDSATAVRTPSRSLFFSLAAGDYIEMMFASDSTAMTLDNIPATAFAPAAPAAILAVNQEQQ